MREFSSGVIIFRRHLNKRLYLLLHYHFKGDYCDFPRGNIEEGETLRQAAIREIREETGLMEDDLKFIEGFKEKTTWFYMWKGQNVFKSVTYFLAETKREDAKISEEHLEFKWLSFKDALNYLTYKNSRELLKEAEKFLQELEERRVNQS